VGSIYCKKCGALISGQSYCHCHKLATERNDKMEKNLPSKVQSGLTGEQVDQYEKMLVPGKEVAYCSVCNRQLYAFFPGAKHTGYRWRVEEGLWKPCCLDNCGGEA